MMIEPFSVTASEVLGITLVSGAVLAIATRIAKLAINWLLAMCRKEHKHIGAGILPYAIIDNEIHFLLSKEGYGPCANTWCDFGGEADPSETSVDTAVRECWEESRGILGDKGEIASKISASNWIGSEDYKMYFLRVDHPSSHTNSDFLQRKFSQYPWMEKTGIKWIKAREVFQAAHCNQPIYKGFFAFFSENVLLRDIFAQTIRNAKRDKRQNRVLENLGIVVI